MGIHHAIYLDEFKGPDTISFTARMCDCVIQASPPAYYGILIPVLSTLVGEIVQWAAQTIADLGEITLSKQYKGVRKVKEKDIPLVAYSQGQGKRRTGQVTHNQLCVDLIKAGVNPEKNR